MADPKAPLLAWGFDPIFFGTERMTRVFDTVSETLPQRRPDVIDALG